MCADNNNDLHTMALRICKKKADIELGTFEASVIHIEQ